MDRQTATTTNTNLVPSLAVPIVQRKKIGDLREVVTFPVWTADHLFVLADHLPILVQRWYPVVVVGGVVVVDVLAVVFVHLVVVVGSLSVHVVLLVVVACVVVLVLLVVWLVRWFYWWFVELFGLGVE